MPTVLLFSPNEIDQEFNVKEGKILFDELELQGLILPHGCLAGSCGSCRIEIINGAENLSAIGAVEADTIESIKKTYYEADPRELTLNKKIRLSCRARVMGDIKIAVLK